MGEFFPTLRGARFVILHDCGHVTMVVSPQEFGDQLLEFLDSVGH